MLQVLEADFARLPAILSRGELAPPAVEPEPVAAAVAAAAAEPAVQLGLF